MESDYRNDGPDSADFERCNLSTLLNSKLFLFFEFRVDLMKFIIDSVYRSAESPSRMSPGAISS